MKKKLNLDKKGSSIACLENGRIKEIRIPCFKAPVIDSTGCGDSYCAGFIMGLSMGWDLEEAGPVVTQPLAAPIEPFKQDASCLVIECLQATVITNDTVIVPVPEVLGSKGCST